MAAYASSGPCAASGAAETILPDARSVCMLSRGDEYINTAPKQLIFALQLPVLCRCWQQLLHKC
eukprot:scaffold14700_cov72-Phaeocystis_antarctica.AAC.3